MKFYFISTVICTQYYIPAIHLYSLDASSSLSRKSFSKPFTTQNTREDNGQSYEDCSNCIQKNCLLTHLHVFPTQFCDHPLSCGVKTFQAEMLLNSLCTMIK